MTRAAVVGRVPTRRNAACTCDPGRHQGCQQLPRWHDRCRTRGRTAPISNTTAQVLLKFHGIYQQDDRDVRRERAPKKLPLDYSCMVRASVPGGSSAPSQWLALDRLAELADGTMRLTTRQGVQFHVVHKGELRALVAGSTRRCSPPWPPAATSCATSWRRRWPDERQAVLQPLVAELVARFRPQTESYWELWVDGEKAVTAAPGAAAVADGPPGSRALRRADLRRRLPAPQVQDRRRLAGRQLHRRLANDVGLVPTLTDGPTGERHRLQRPRRRRAWAWPTPGRTTPTRCWPSPSAGCRRTPR